MEEMKKENLKNSDIMENIILQNNKRINYSLNFVKCIAIFAVICIHCGLFSIGNKGLVIDALSRFAVPIFFLISGFYSYFDNYSHSLNKYKRRLIKLIMLYIFSNILYLFYNILTNQYVDFVTFLKVFNLSSIFNYIFLDISPFAVHLWFIIALIYCYVIYYILTKLSINPRILYKYIPILLIVCLFMGEFSQRIGLLFPIEFYRNFLFMGLPFFTLGYLIHDKENIFIQFSNRSLIVLGLLGILLTILEVLVVGKSDIFTGIILFAICVFIWCVKNPKKLNFKITEFIGGKLYTSMYILHLLVLGIIAPDYGYLNPVIGFIGTAIVSSIIYFIYIQLNGIINNKGFNHE